MQSVKEYYYFNRETYCRTKDYYILTISERWLLCIINTKTPAEKSSKLDIFENLGSAITLLREYGVLK
jgi:hypothetical protein